MRFADNPLASISGSSTWARDIDGLRICDASITQTITSGKTNAATMMTGERAAIEILREAQAHQTL